MIADSLIRVLTIDVAVAWYLMLSHSHVIQGLIHQTLSNSHSVSLVSTMSASELSELTAARYGKTKVRVFRIVRQGSWHHIVEYNVEALLEGEISTR